ncbi:MAG TPA: YbjN domain-containing protein [Caulobacteraceae bacterium]|nr:YbjN domain-containing protein [Caulobacteraceae bacterium]
MRRQVWLALGVTAALAGAPPAWAAPAASAADAFDARRAADVAAVVTNNGASGELKAGADGKPMLEAQAGRIYFDVDFDDCDTAKALCDTVTFAGWWDTDKLNADLINRWNRWTLFCPAYLDAKGAPSMWYGLAVSQHTAKDDIATAVDRWMGCLQDFDDFVASPDDFLKRKDTSAAPAAPAPPPAPQHPADHPPGRAI